MKWFTTELIFQTPNVIVYYMTFKMKGILYVYYPQGSRVDTFNLI